MMTHSELATGLEQLCLNFNSRESYLRRCAEWRVLYGDAASNIRKQRAYVRKRMQEGAYAGHPQKTLAEYRGHAVLLLQIRAMMKQEAARQRAAGLVAAE